MRARSSLRLLVTALAALASLASAPAAAAQSAATLAVRGLDHYYNLEYDAAVADFSRQTAAEPGNATAWNHLAQTVLYREMYRIGALESQLYGKGDAFLASQRLPPDPTAVAQFLGDNQHAMQAANAVLRAHPGDASAHYALGAAWALRGTLEFSVRGAYMPALSDAKAARREAEQAIALDPALQNAELILGAHNYIAGSLPWTAKLFAIALGYGGDKGKGRAQIAAVARSQASDATDAQVLLAVIDRRDGLNQQAAPLLLALAQRYPRNVLFAVEAGEALDAAGEHEAARKQLRTVLQRSAAQAPGYARAPLDQVWYDLGSIERLYSRWGLAASDFQHAEAPPHTQAALLPAAALAAGQMEVHAGNLAAARAEFERCRAASPNSPLARTAARAEAQISHR